MSARISGYASMSATVIGMKKGTVRFGNTCLSFAGPHLFRVSDDGHIFVEAVLAPTSWWRRLLKSDIEFRNGDGAVVARYRAGKHLLVVGTSETCLHEDARLDSLTSPYAIVHCPESSAECQFETSPETIQGVVAVAVHQLYLKRLRAG